MRSLKQVDTQDIVVNVLERLHDQETDTINLNALIDVGSHFDYVEVTIREALHELVERQVLTPFRYRSPL